MLTISSLATVYIKASVKATIAGATVDPTSDTVTVAFLAAGSIPVSGDFAAATWETAIVNSLVSYYVRRLATTLAAGRYDMWVKIIRDPETVVALAGSFVVV